MKKKLDEQKKRKKEVKHGDIQTKISSTEGWQSD